MLFPNLLINLLQIFLCLIVVDNSVKSINPDVFTHPKDLGFEMYTKQSSASKTFHLIQPKAEGSIFAYLGPHNSTHFYKMASISAFLNTHIIFSHRAYTSPLYALCSIENSYLVAQQNAFIVCAFKVYIPSFESHVFTNASCVIRCVNQTECAVQLDLEFLRLQFPTASSQLSILVSYNVTAYQVNQSNGLLQYIERPEITESLIYKSRVLPPVTVISQPEFTWFSLIRDTHDIPIIQIGIPSVRMNKAASMLLSVSSKAYIQEFKIKLLLSSTLRYHFERPVQTEQARSWRVSVASKLYGAVVRVRKAKSSLTALNQSTGSASLEPNLVTIAELVLEQVAQSDAKSTASQWDDRFKTVDATQSEYLDVPWEHAAEDDSEETTERSGQPLIRVQLVHLVQNNVSQISKGKPLPTLTLMAPQLLPQPDAMHVFVMFEPRDIIEPPWYPAAPSPEPLRLRVIGLIPFVAKRTNSPDSLDSLFGSQSVGRLTDITRHVFCRPASGRSPGERPIDTTSSSSPACSTGMRRAPIEVEEFSSLQNGPLHGLRPNMLTYAAGGLGARLGWSDQLVLALATPAGQATTPNIVPSMYGSVNGPNDQNWAWRDWRGPTVRRWMLEGFRIHVSRRHLRRISAWKVPATSVYDKQFSNNSTTYVDRYEQAQITVTSRIYTLRPGTGQRIYLGQTAYGDAPDSLSYKADSASKEHKESDVMEFDVTHLLPSWALVVRPVNDLQNKINPLPGAYIHYDAFTERPHLVGRWPGRVMLGIVATLGDTQPLASTYIDVGGREQKDSRGITVEETISVVAIRAECVNPDLRLSGQLEPAPMGGTSSTGSVLFENSLNNPSESLISSMTELRSVTDYSLPTPHRLSIELYVADSGGDSLITAAASSTTRGPEVLHSIFNEKRFSGSQSYRTIPSSATCPVQLLSVNLIMSDETVLAAHQVPENHLRISSFDSDLVWDPAVPIQPAVNRAKRTTERPTPGVYIRVNSLIVWPAHALENANIDSTPTVPLGAMDDVILAIKSGRSLRDPGPPQKPYKWFAEEAHATNIGRREVSTINGYGGIDANTGTPSSWSSLGGQFHHGDQRPMLVSAQNNRRALLYEQTGNQDNRSTPMITYILVSVGVVSVLLFTINCTVILALRKRRQTRASGNNQGSGSRQMYSIGSSFNERNRKIKKSSVGQIDLYNVEGNECTLKQNGSCGFGSASVGSPLVPCNQLSYLPSYSDVHSGQLLMGNSSPRQVDATQMAAGLSCSSMGSANSGPTGSLKQSMLIDQAVNPYLMSEGSSLGAAHSNKNSQVGNVPPFNMPCMPINFHPSTMSNSPPSWNSPLSMTPSSYPKSFPIMNAMQMTNCSIQSPVSGWPAGISPTNSGPCNPGYTSGVGSVGTCEGCSDEGVALGSEMISVSQEIFNINAKNGVAYAHPTHLHRTTMGSAGRSATGGTNSTASGTSMNGFGQGLPNRTLMSTFKRSPTSGIGAGSLSGDSSSADANEFRSSIRPESTGMNDVEETRPIHSLGPGPLDNTYASRTSSSKFRGSPTLPIPDARFSPVCTTRMVESFTHLGTPFSASSAVTGIYSAVNSTISPNSGLRVAISRHHSSLRTNPSIAECKNRHEPLATSAPFDSEVQRDSKFTEDSEDAPVPLPPALLLNSHGCFDALSSQTHTSGLVQAQFNNMKPSQSPCESRLTFGSYKRSDSFGMATKPHALGSLAPITNTQLSDFQKGPSLELNLYSNIDNSQGAAFARTEEMVGDTLDQSDEVSSESKASSANRSEAKAVQLMELSGPTMNDKAKLTYLHNIPPPEL